MNKTIENFIRHSYYAKWIASRFLKLICSFYPAFDANRVFKRHFGRKMDLKKPITLPEKIVWMELHTDTSMWTYCEDKYLMRKYVEKKGYGDYLPELYTVWQKSSDIDLSILPNKFVMKTNHGCGDVLVCNDKTILDTNRIKKKFKQILSIPYGYNSTSLHYVKIKPCIIAEELLNNDFNDISTSMVDFKIWCINGKMKSVLIIYNRKNEKYSVDLYDRNWNRLPQYLNYKNKDLIFEKDSKFKSKPRCFDKMVEIAENLANGFPEVRVDFYIVNSRPIIGEMTFAAGYTSLTEEYFTLLANEINLTKLC